MGERPGLGQSESLSCYAVYWPLMATTVEADRTCISNIHQGGTPPVEAAAVIVGFGETYAGAESIRHQHDPIRRHHASFRFDSTVCHRYAGDCLR